MVIPAFNEQSYLPSLLDTVDRARQQYRRGSQAIEIIVADNASTDDTAAVAMSRGCRVVYVEKPVIAAARNGGARAARGEILAFVDADSQIHPETFNAIEDTLASGRVIVGASGVGLSRMSPALALLMLVAVPMTRIARLDSGVVFCRREDWEAVGGYNEARPVAEDIQFLLDLKRLGRERGQGYARARGVKAITSTRKFDKHGDWQFLLGMLRAPLLGLLDPPALERWIRRYWYEDRGSHRGPPPN
jgi:glycosyltransferase involved in cell wall biosynthesis